MFFYFTINFVDLDGLHMMFKRFENNSTKSRYIQTMAVTECSPASKGKRHWWIVLQLKFVICAPSVLF